MRVFSIFVHSAGSTVPSFSFQQFDDESGAHALARMTLSKSPERLLVEVREEDRLLFSVDRNGVWWPSDRILGANLEAEAPPH